MSTTYRPDPSARSVSDRLASEVAVTWGPSGYSASPPYSPGVAWPEYHHVCHHLAPMPNPVYQAVRDTLHLLRLDQANYGSPTWNPLGPWISPGDTVLLKPNFVRDFRESSSDHANCLFTHGSIIRAVADYAYIALGGRGRIIIADAPQNDANFERIRSLAGLDALRAFYREVVGFPLEAYDLRQEAARKIAGVIVGHRALEGDPAGYVTVDLGAHSALTAIDHLSSRLYGAEYDRRELVAHHQRGLHQYLISQTVLDADCIISIPKLKTHKKTGITVNMKNLVGINGNKNWLPHHRDGTPSQGGDQFDSDGLRSRAERAVVNAFKRSFPMLGALRPLLARPIKTLGTRIFGDTNTNTIRSGNWFGNDTTWRMVLDLNRLLLYADAAGRLHDKPQRRFFSVVDGIIAGEGNGPLDAQPKPVGLVAAGSSALAVDLTCARLMGFDYEKIPMLSRAFGNHPLPLASFAVSEIRLRSNDDRTDRRLLDLSGPQLTFKPHFGWIGHIELTENFHEARTLA